MFDTRSTARRSLLSGLGAAVAATVFGSRQAAQAQAPAQTPQTAFQPARHAQDEWLGSVPGKHRTVIDCATPGQAGSGLLYANNLYVANLSGYALKETDVAVVVCLRHWATAFAFTDAVWAKYGKAMSDAIQFTDPRTKQAPSANLLAATGYGTALPNFGITIASVAGRGTQFAICDMATTNMSRQIATATGASQPEVYKELVANLIPNSHLMAAGVVAVNRAQEYGFTLLTPA